MNEEQVMKLVCDLGFYVAPNGNGFWDSKSQLLAFANACCDYQRESDAKICLQLGRTQTGTDYIEIADAIRSNKGE